MKDSSEKNRIVIVVPCYNEAERWNLDYWAMLSAYSNLKIIFVNDGSTDNTVSKIQEFIDGTEHTLLNLEKNVGKAEAIRMGFTNAFALNPNAIGFLDADEAFSFYEVTRQIEKYLSINRTSGNSTAVWSSRVQLAGREVNRDISRHYLARILITLLAARHRFSIYDPQSGLKIYPNSDHLQKCFSKKFATRWFVDLEIYIRWKNNVGTWMRVWEEPVVEWRDIGGSKICGKEYFRILKDIGRLLITHH